MMCCMVKAFVCISNVYRQFELVIEHKLALYFYSYCCLLANSLLKINLNLCSYLNGIDVAQW